jgi:hypothetical protein
MLIDGFTYLHDLHQGWIWLSARNIQILFLPLDIVRAILVIVILIKQESLDHVHRELLAVCRGDHK